MYIYTDTNVTVVVPGPVAVSSDQSSSASNDDDDTPDDDHTNDNYAMAGEGKYYY